MPASPSPWDRLIEHGVLGIVLLIALYAIAYLWGRINAERDAKDALQKAHAAEIAALQKEHAATVAALQESRLQGMQKTTEVLVNATASLNNSAEAQRDMNDSLKTIISEYAQRRGRP